MKSGPKRTDTWGLTPCPPHRPCAVCAALEDQLWELHHLRELYTEGMPVWHLARMFRVPNSDLRSHAWHHNWHRRRSYNLPDPKYLFTSLALTRMRETWHLAAPTSADRMLELLYKIVRDGSDKAVTEDTMTLSWESGSSSGAGR